MDLRNALLGSGHEEERDRLEELREQEAKDIEATGYRADQEIWMQDDELVSLWRVFKTHTSWTGVRPTMRDFGCWLAGTEYRTMLVNAETEAVEAATVTW